MTPPVWAGTRSPVPVTEASTGAMGAPAGAASAETARQFKRYSRRGKLKTRVMTKSNAALTATLVAFGALTVYTMLTINYGKVALFDAFVQMLKNLMVMFFQPGLAGHFTAFDVFEGVLITVALSVLTTFIGAAIAFVLGLLASANLSNRVLANAIKAVMSVFRAVPTILWVLVFTVALGLGAGAAVVGLLFHSIAYLVKAYSECFEEVDAGVLDALRACGASWWHVVFKAVVPEKISQMLSWTFIRFEINFTNAIAIGAIAGAGGIGYQLFLAGSFYFSFREVGLIVYCCLAVAVVLEVIATKLRKRYILHS
ncbi:MAG: ABC transporter permease subunit [Eggerthellaceae bacterium]|nr:ABC transporter permease subunit [Eggerthellaceae bacterium]